MSIRQSRWARQAMQYEVVRWLTVLNIVLLLACFLCAAFGSAAVGVFMVALLVTFCFNAAFMVLTS